MVRGFRTEYTSHVTAMWAQISCDSKKKGLNGQTGRPKCTLWMFRFSKRLDIVFWHFVISISLEETVTVTAFYSDINVLSIDKRP